MTAIAFFRPDDERATEAMVLLENLGVNPVSDPMLQVEPTGSMPREDADYTLLTSKTGVELAAEADWSGSGTICAVGERTAASLREHGYTVDLVPDEYSSRGLVRALDGRVDGARCEVARSDHGAELLTEQLAAAGAYVHETVLYRLVRPPGTGESTVRAADGELDGVLFTSSLTVKHFLIAASERGIREQVIDELGNSVVGAIGEPTRATAEEAGIDVDVVPERASFEPLARTVVDRVTPSSTVGPV